MEGTIAGAAPAVLKNEQEFLQQSLKAAVDHFKIGEDAAGLDSFLSAVKGLELAVEADRNSRQPRIDLNQLLPAMRELSISVRNQDITGITDLLERALYPLTEEWFKGSDGT